MSNQLANLVYDHNNIQGQNHDELRENIKTLLLKVGSSYYFEGSIGDKWEDQGLDDILENFMSLFTRQLELAKIEAKIEELKSLDFDDVYDRRNKVVVTFGEIEDRVAKLTKQKEEIKIMEKLNQQPKSKENEL